MPKLADRIRVDDAAHRARQRMGACYRTFVAAAHGERLEGNYYELPLAERERWADEAKKSAVALGLVLP